MEDKIFVWFPVKSSTDEWFWLSRVTKFWNPEKDTLNTGWLCDAPVYIGGWDYKK
ncbi:MAG: hypothetical protein K2X69_16305 [Silvanigrellaceae bacterium]|nr:hypothetical protein [Silvanigrellaceae bacterium]